MIENIPYYLFSALAVLISLSIHEYSHALAAYKLGDNTAKDSGRLTLNPISHLDPFGALCMLIFHFGWAKPVPIDPRNFDNPKKGIAIVSFAGPLSNLSVSVISAFIYLLLYRILSPIAYPNNFLFSMAQNTLDFVYVLHLINIGLAIFNLLPIPPLDGSGILQAFLPPKAWYKIIKHERTIYFALVGWLLLGDYASSMLLSLRLVSSNVLFSSIAKLLSLSDILGFIMTRISDFIFFLFELIPFLNV